MKKSPVLKGIALIVFLIGVSLVIVSYAAEEIFRLATKDTDKIVSQRRAIMRNSSDNLTDARDKLTAGKIKEIAVNADNIILNILLNETLFPENSISPTSRALLEIWKDFDEFKKISLQLKETTEELSKNAKAKNTDAVKTLIAKVNDVCSSCHNKFRAKKAEKK